MKFLLPLLEVVSAIVIVFGAVLIHVGLGLIVTGLILALIVTRPTSSE